MKKRILIATPRFPLPTLGACEQDRMQGIKQLIRLGYDIYVIAKVFDFQDKSAIEKFATDNSIKLILVPYRQKRSFSIARQPAYAMRRILAPYSWDGSAYEYFDPVIQLVVKRIILRWKPDFFWADYTYLWPLYHIPQRAHVPIVTRSINFEPYHFLEEDGYTFINYLKTIPKFASEILAIRKSDVLLAITPKEERWYRRLGAKNVITLPLRRLPKFLFTKREENKDRLIKVFFMGSTYNVAHNRAALEHVIAEVAPRIESKIPGKYVFQILGNKMPEEKAHYIHGNVIYSGPLYDEAYESFLSSINIAIIPSLFGAGMQQKVFEPICRGIPTITSPRAIAGYPFEEGVHYLGAVSVDEFIEQLIRLGDASTREKIGNNGRERAREIFSQDILDGIVERALSSIETNLS